MYTSQIEIESFLKEYERSRVVTITSVRSVLNRALEFEQKFHKPFYLFTIEEILEMYRAARAISNRSLQNANLALKHATKWIAYTKNIEIRNVYDDITKDLITSCVDEKKKESQILTKDDLEEIQSQLLNWTDKSILFLLFEGAGGYMLKELTFMQWEQVSRKDLKMYWKNGKIINITPKDYDMLRQGFYETELISFGETNRISRVKSLGMYKARFNTLSDNANPADFGDVERRYRFVMRRLNLISKDLGVTLTSSGLQESGFLHYIREGMQTSGLSFLEYIRTEEARALARRYDLYTDLYIQIIKDKFFKYFQ